MKRNSRLYFLALVFAAQLLAAQPVQKIRFKKNSTLIYFFQKGAKADTIAKGRGDLFYLLVPDTLKGSISIVVENGRLLPTGNDSLVSLNYIAGLQYESLYSKAEVTRNKAALMERHGTAETQKAELKTLIDGTSAAPAGTIILRITDKKSETLLIENTFYYRP